MRNPLTIIKANGANILKRGAIAMIVIAGWTIVSKTFFAANLDEDIYEHDDAIINDDDDDSDDE